MLTPHQIKNLLKQNNITALKSFGQNFLVSQTAIDKVIEASSITSADTIIEIGPGFGSLTFEIAKKANKVIAVEKDRKISSILKQALIDKKISNVEVINEDVLKIQNAKVKSEKYNSKVKSEDKKKDAGFKLPTTNYKVVANLPYNIAVAVVMKFLTSQNPPQEMVVMLQKEVAQRIVATPPKANKLAIFCQLYSTPKIIGYVPSTAFYPKPKVDSAILELQPLGRRLPPSSFGEIERLVNIGFSHPRKTLLNNFVRGLPSYSLSKKSVVEWIKGAGLDPSQRPQTLTIHNWLTLAKTLKTFHNN